MLTGFVFFTPFYYVYDKDGGLNGFQVPKIQAETVVGGGPAVGTTLVVPNNTNFGVDPEELHE
ncbi:MAG: hypothetical protein ABI480_03730 [Chitinophagaceae bacterium]